MPEKELWLNTNLYLYYLLSHLFYDMKCINKYSTVIEIFMYPKKGGRQQVAK